MVALFAIIYVTIICICLKKASNKARIVYPDNRGVLVGPGISFPANYPPPVPPPQVFRPPSPIYVAQFAVPSHTRTLMIIGIALLILPLY